MVVEEVGFFLTLLRVSTFSLTKRGTLRGNWSLVPEVAHIHPYVAFESHPRY